MPIQETISLIVALVSFVGALSALYRIAHIADSKTFKLLQEDNTRLHNDNNSLMTRLQKWEADHLSDREKIIGLEADRTADRVKIKALEADRATDRQRLIAAEVERAESRDKIIGLEADVRDLRTSRDKLLVANGQLEKVVNDQNAVITSYTGQIQTMQEELKAERLRRSEVLDRFESLGRSLNQIQMERDTLQISNVDLQNRLDSRSSEMEQLAARIYDLEHPARLEQEVTP
jgi:chromosome segregation ATPase